MPQIFHETCIFFTPQFSLIVVTDVDKVWRPSEDKHNAHVTCDKNTPLLKRVPFGQNTNRPFHFDKYKFNIFFLTLENKVVFLILYHL